MEPLLEREALSLDLPSGELALELRLVERLKALDEHLRLLRDDAVAVGPLVDPSEHGHRLADGGRELLGVLDPEALDELALRHAQVALELLAHHGLGVLVRVRNLALHEGEDAGDLADERTEEVLAGRHGRCLSFRRREKTKLSPFRAKSTDEPSKVVDRLGAPRAHLGYVSVRFIAMAGSGSACAKTYFISVGTTIT